MKNDNRPQAPTQETEPSTPRLSYHNLTVSVPLRDFEGTKAQRCQRLALESELTALSLSRMQHDAAKWQAENSPSDCLEVFEDFANVSRLTAALIVASRDYTDAAHFPEPEPPEA